MCKRIVLSSFSCGLFEGNNKSFGFTAHLPTECRTLTVIRVTTGGLPSDPGRSNGVAPPFYSQCLVGKPKLDRLRLVFLSCQYFKVWVDC